MHHFNCEMLWVSLETSETSLIAYVLARPDLFRADRIESRDDAYTRLQVLYLFCSDKMRLIKARSQYDRRLADAKQKSVPRIYTDGRRLYRQCTPQQDVAFIDGRHCLLDTGF